MVSEMDPAAFAAKFDFFFNGTLKEAQREAQSRAKFFFVYLHAPDHPRSARFVNDVFGDLMMQMWLRENFVCWGCSVKLEQGHVVSRELDVTSFPYVAIGIKTRFVMDMTGAIDAAALHQQGNACLANNAHVQAKEVAFVFERDERERARQMQEQALKEAMEADKKRLAEMAEAKRREEEEAQRAAQQRQEEERRMAREREAREAHQRAEELRAARVEEQKALAMSMLSDPPPEGTPQDEVATIQLLSIDGTANARTFRRTEPLSALFYFAESREEYQGQHYELLTGFPPRPIGECRETPIGDIRVLCPRARVTMKEVVDTTESK